MKKLLLYHHLGLGDHIICHGMVREFCKQYETTIFCKEHNYWSVIDMFSDLANLHIIKGNDSLANSYIETNKNQFDHIKRIGFEKLNSSENFEEQFYRIANIDFQKKWINFYLPQNEMSVSIYEELNLKQYNFIHSDTNRNFCIKEQYINNNYFNFFTHSITVPSIIHYAEIIKNASEIHVIDSAFMFLIDCMKYNNKEQ